MKKYYASVLGKLPRKRKEQRFEVQLMGDTQIEAKAELSKLITTNQLRDVRCAVIQLWEVSETDFVDVNGIKQTIVFRNIFPSGSAIAIDLEGKE